MRIAFDAGSGPPRPAVEGALRAALELGHEIILVGPEASLRAEAQGLPQSPAKSRLSFLDAPRDSATTAAREAASGKAAALVCASEPAAACAAALWHLKRLPNALRPALAVAFPTRKGASILLDAGANSDCKPWHLLQFAVMGSLFARKLRAAPEPSVGLISSRAGDGKGSPLVQEALALLKLSKLNFMGLLDARDVPAGAADVVVVDGPTGDILLRLMEAMAAVSPGMIESVPQGALARLGSRLVPAFAKGAGPRPAALAEEPMALLGVGGCAVLCRGRSSAAAFDACRLAGSVAESGVLGEIRDRLSDLKSSLELMPGEVDAR